MGENKVQAIDDSKMYDFTHEAVKALEETINCTEMLGKYFMNSLGQPILYDKYWSMPLCLDGKNEGAYLARVAVCQMEFSQALLLGLLKRSPYARGPRDWAYIQGLLNNARILFPWFCLFEDFIGAYGGLVGMMAELEREELQAQVPFVSEWLEQAMIMMKFPVSPPRKETYSPPRYYENIPMFVHENIFGGVCGLLSLCRKTKAGVSLPAGFLEQCRISAEKFSGKNHGLEWYFNVCEEYFFYLLERDGASAELLDQIEGVFAWCMENRNRFSDNLGYITAIQGLGACKFETQHSLDAGRG